MTWSLLTNKGPVPLAITWDCVFDVAGEILGYQSRNNFRGLPNGILPTKSVTADCHKET